ncbi:MAG: NUDIX domain-containing protein [candidate division NC10 bacterium]|nr:NUDIX domain-containing protein [candidate division NC10 bacterium]
MRQEVSAGVILFYRGSAREYLVLDYGSHWDYPKGHLKAGETSRNAALRELQEETGIAGIRLLPGFEERIRYTYRKAGTAVWKRVVYYLGESLTRAVALSEEHHDYAWLGYPEALNRLTYPSARQLLRKAERFLSAAPRPETPPGDPLSTLPRF